MEWIRTHPWIGTAFFAGVFLGILISMPLIPYRLPEGAATLIGSALGAAIAVLGASWVAQGQLERERRAVLIELHREFKNHRAAFSKVPRDPDFEHAVSAGLHQDCIAFRDATDKFHTRIQKMEGLFQRVGANGFIAYADVLGAMSRLSSPASTLASIAKHPQNYDDPGGQFTSNYDDARAAMKQLDTLARSLR